MQLADWSNYVKIYNVVRSFFLNREFSVPSSPPPYILNPTSYIATT